MRKRSGALNEKDFNFQGWLFNHGIVVMLGTLNETQQFSSWSQVKATGRNIGLDRVERKVLQQKENRGFLDGHTTGYYTLFTSPFVVGDSTIFKINPSTSFTPRIFICHRGVR